ncbi:MAG TPA: hypothetical protein VKZ44_02085 [Taishania sp.]|nr:hypothetical protein [Taishania sp.]
MIIIKLTLIVLAVFLVGCSTFSKVAIDTKVVNDDGYTKVYNEQVNFGSYTFGDFEFATNNKMYKRLRSNQIKVKDVLFFATTVNPSYTYYVLHNPKNIEPYNTHFDITEATIGEHRFVMLVSKTAPSYDRDFLMKNIFPNKVD